MSLRVLVLVVTLAVVCAGCGGQTESGISEQDYVRANERLLETLPQFPRAREVARSSAPYFAGDSAGSPPAGYTTNVAYEVPSSVGQREVVDFYVEQLPEWRPRVEYTPGVDVATGESRPGAWNVMLTRRDASVGINTDNLSPPAGRRFEVVVDHRGAAS